MAANTNEKSGCLSTFLPFLKPKQVKSAVPIPAVRPASPPPPPPRLPYRLRDDFLTPVEFSFYKILSLSNGTRFTVQSKVRLADIFFVAERDRYYADFNRISARHLDFLLCDSLTMKPLLGIELDDSSHDQIDRQERDEFVDRVFHDAGLPLLRIPARREYNSREIMSQIEPFLKEIGDAVTPPKSENISQESGVPNCPKCGIPMVLRTTSQGNHKGSQFYGCKNYPRCREVKAIFVQTDG